MQQSLAGGAAGASKGTLLMKKKLQHLVLHGWEELGRNRAGCDHFRWPFAPGKPKARAWMCWTPPLPRTPPAPTGDRCTGEGNDGVSSPVFSSSLDFTWAPGCVWHLGNTTGHRLGQRGHLVPPQPSPPGTQSPPQPLPRRPLSPGRHSAGPQRAAASCCGPMEVTRGKPSPRCSVGVGHRITE